MTYVGDKIKRGGVYCLDLSLIDRKQVEKLIQVYIYVYNVLCYRDYSTVFVNREYKKCADQLPTPLTEQEKAYFRLWYTNKKSKLCGKSVQDCGGPNCHAP